MLDENQARRLARAICADVLLYNEAAKSAPVDQRAGLLAAPVQEGRELFIKRASAGQQFIFDQALDELIARPLGLELRTLLGAPVPAQALPGRPSVGLDAPQPEKSSPTPLLIGVALLVLAAALGAYFMLA